MSFNLDSFNHLPLKGAKYQIKPKTLRAHQKYYTRSRGRKGLSYRSFCLYVFIALVIGCTMLHDAYPNWFGGPFFTGVFVGIFVFLTLGLLLNSRERRRVSKEATAYEDMLIGVDGDVLWLGLEKKIFRFFVSPAAFKSVKFNGDYIYGYILTGGTIIVEQSVLLQSEQGKAVHAWLARAKAEIDFGGR